MTKKPIERYVLCAFCAVGMKKDEAQRLTTRGKTRFVCDECVKKFWTPTESRRSTS